jgi:hypothetical protein
MLAIRPEKITTSHIQLRPGVIPEKPLQRRIRIVADTAISGVLVWKNSVLDVTIPDWVMLRDSLKAVIVDNNTPLIMAPAPVDPYADRPKLFLDCVESGLNSLTEIAPVLNASKLDASKIARRLIESGLISLNDRGVYIRTAKKAA